MKSPFLRAGERVGHSTGEATVTAPVLGIIAPHPPIMVREVGGAKTGVTSASIEGMRIAADALRRFAPETIVVISPHSPALADAFAVDTAPRTAGTLARFGARRAGISARTDTEFADHLLEHLAAAGVPALSRESHAGLESGALDHGVLVPLSFLDPEGTYPLVNLSLSGLSLEMHRRLGDVVAEVAAALNRRIVFVASGDLSHRLTPDAPAGFSPRGHEFDDLIVEHLRAGDLDAIVHIDRTLADAAGECGLRSLITLSGVIPGASARVLSYEGPWGVGYLTALVGREQDISFDETATAPAGRKGGAAGDDEHELVALARHAITSYVARGAEADPWVLEDASLPERAGVFVSLHLEGRLRGCIGTIAPTQPTLAQEVAHNAVQAATADPRFPAVTAAEVPLLDVKVDVLHSPEECSFEQLDPSRFGVIVSCGWRRGLLLPDLEGVDSAAQQVEIARQKAGIGPSEPCALERFRVDRYA